MNIARAAVDLKAKISKQSLKSTNVIDLRSYLVKEIEEMLQNDIDDNMKIGNFGREHIMKSFTDGKIKILTHCNTGSLATVKYGTALGVIRCLHEKGLSFLC